MGYYPATNHKHEEDEGSYPGDNLDDSSMLSHAGSPGVAGDT